MNAAAARDCTRATETNDRNPIGIDRDFHGVPVDPRKGDGDQNFGIGLMISIGGSQLSSGIGAAIG